MFFDGAGGSRGLDWLRIINSHQLFTLVLLLAQLQRRPTGKRTRKSPPQEAKSCESYRVLSFKGKVYRGVEYLLIMKKQAATRLPLFID